MIPLLVLNRQSSTLSKAQMSDIASNIYQTSIDELHQDGWVSSCSQSHTHFTLFWSLLASWYIPIIPYGLLRHSHSFVFLSFFHLLLSFLFLTCSSCSLYRSLYSSPVRFSVPINISFKSRFFKLTNLIEDVHTWRQTDQLVWTFGSRTDDADGELVNWSPN